MCFSPLQDRDLTTLGVGPVYLPLWPQCEARVWEQRYSPQRSRKERRETWILLSPRPPFPSEIPSPEAPMQCAPGRRWWPCPLCQPQRQGEAEEGAGALGRVCGNPTPLKWADCEGTWDRSTFYPYDGQEVLSHIWLQSLLFYFSLFAFVQFP